MIFSSPLFRLKVEDFIQSPAHRMLSLEAAMATVVLMKNTATMGMTLPITSPVNAACVGIFYKHLLFSVYTIVFLTLGCRAIY